MTEADLVEYYFVVFELTGIGTCMRGPWHWNEAMTHLNTLVIADVSTSEERLEPAWQVLP